MRMILPGARERRAIDRQLTDFFRAHREVEFRHAIRIVVRKAILDREVLAFGEARISQALTQS